jgi:glutamate synthase (NADPH/NADH) large chain
MESVERQGLYDPRNEHDACGVGFVVNIKGRKSRDIIGQGLKILENLDHRGAVGADPLMGDGAGILIQTPDALLHAWATKEGKTLPAAGRYAVAMCFLPREQAALDLAISHFGEVVAKEGQTLVGWREVPTDTAGLGEAAIASMPVIRQAIVAASPSIKDQNAFERKILAIRKQILNNLRRLSEKRKIPGLDALYMPSFSTRTVVYKGLLLATQVGSFYKDLRDPLCLSALALVHQRFSTNTFPSWRIRIVSSRITGKLTPFAATSTGCRRAAGRCPPT